MNFKEQLTQLSQQVAERKQYVINEETTKQSLIIPFIQLLGFDVFNPLEVRPEYSADFARKKGARIDYAIFNNDEALIFFEAKPVNENLEKHSSQLAYYFNSTHQLKLAILTNGIEYYFFTDLNVANVMDDSPFFRLNILSITDESLKILEHIRKQSFNTKLICELAEELVYKKDLDIAITRLLKEPTNDFIRFLIKDILHARITSAVIDKFKPLVKKSILNSAEIIYHENFGRPVERPVFSEAPPYPSTRSKSKKTTETVDEKPERANITVAIQVIDESAASVDIQQIEQNEIGLQVYQRVKEMLDLECLDTDILKCQMTLQHFIIYVETMTNWILKVCFIDGQNYIVIPFPPEDVMKRIGNLLRYEQDNEGTKIHIDKIQDSYKLAKLIIQRFLHLQGKDSALL